MIDLLLVDFDDVLLDIGQFVPALIRSLEPFGISGRDFYESYPESLGVGPDKRGWAPAIHIHRLRARLTFDEDAALSALERTIAETNTFLFPDALPFLTSARQLTHSLVLCSRGDTETQQKKIAASGVRAYFDRVLTGPEEKSVLAAPVLSSPSRVWFIDDKVVDAENMTSHFPFVQPVLRRSPRVPAEEYARTSYPIFDSLTDVTGYLERV